jgi:cardiolipin-specific phospholipase
MDPEGGRESVERLRQAGNGQGRMYIISHAGHHGTLLIQCDAAYVLTFTSVYLDNVKAVNELLVKELERP